MLVKVLLSLHIDHSISITGPMTAATNNCSTKEPSIDFKVIYNKKKYDVTLPLDTDIGALKTHLHPIIDIPPAMMKVRKPNALQIIKIFMQLVVIIKSKLTFISLGND